MLFQITLTVIGRPKYYAADMRGAEIRIHLVLKSRQHHSFPAPHLLLAFLRFLPVQSVSYGALGMFEIHFKRGEIKLIS